MKLGGSLSRWPRWAIGAMLLVAFFGGTYALIGGLRWTFRPSPPPGVQAVSLDQARELVGRFSGFPYDLSAEQKKEIIQDLKIDLMKLRPDYDESFDRIAYWYRDVRIVDNRARNLAGVLAMLVLVLSYVAAGFSKRIALYGLIPFVGFFVWFWMLRDLADYLKGWRVPAPRRVQEPVKVG